jgi:MerR family transcriptional regulator, repressor of the yfmOP operon
MTVDTETRLRIGEVAERVGITTRTIRYYEELGLLGAHAGRTKGAHRVYTEADVVRLRELIRLRDALGLTLDELVELAEAEEARAALRDQWHGDPSDEERLRILDQALALVDQQLELVSARQQVLAAFADELKTKRTRLRRLRRELESA